MLSYKFNILDLLTIYIYIYILYPLTKKHCKILAIDTHSPINVPKTITTEPTQIKLNEIGNDKKYGSIQHLT